MTITERQSAIVAEAQSWLIYGLHETGCDRIRYVGYTKNPKRRLSDHLREGRLLRRRYPLYDWINSVILRGRQVSLRVLEAGNGDWKEAERRWIAYFGRDHLFNATDGGDSVGKISPEARASAREKLRHRVFAPEHRARIAESKKGRPRPDAAGYLKNYMAAKSADERSDHARKARSAITADGYRRLRESSRLSTRDRWARMSAEERAEISARSSAQMKRVWERRRATHD